jgi:hypothetical protein
MTEQTSADSLVTEPPLSSTHTVIDPAAEIDPAAKLDPAKARPKPKRQRARKKAPSKKAAAKRASAASAGSLKRAHQGKAKKAAAAVLAADADEARAAYEAAKLHIVANYAGLPAEAPLHLRFANGQEFTGEGTEVSREDLRVDGARAVYERLTDFAPEAPPAKVTEAWLIAESGEAVRCEIGVGFACGGGHHAVIPAGHLIF